eukprot:scaffold20741_cov129-Skeletonema_marinoi.AAC.3
MYRLTNGTIPIIGVGGVGSGRDAYDKLKLKAGASLIQVYSMKLYEGPGVVSRIRKELADVLAENGYKSVEVGWCRLRRNIGLRRGLGRGWRRRRSHAFEQH